MPALPYHQWLVALLCGFMALQVSATEPAPETATAAQASSPITVTHLSDDYDVVRQSVEMAILDQGFVVSGTLRISAMLERTAADLKLPAPAYQHAESLEFCSAFYSHKMTEVDPQNIAICPFSIAVYNLKDQPDTVYIAYRPVVLPNADRPDVSALQAEINAMLATVVENALP